MAQTSSVLQLITSGSFLHKKIRKFIGAKSCKLIVLTLLLGLILLSLTSYFKYIDESLKPVAWWKLDSYEVNYVTARAGPYPANLPLRQNHKLRYCRINFNKIDATATQLTDRYSQFSRQNYA